MQGLGELGKEAPSLDFDLGDLGLPGTPTPKKTRKKKTTTRRTTRKKKTTRKRKK